MCAMKYYEPDSKAQYKQLKKNWKKEMKRPKPQFENHLKEYESSEVTKSPNLPRPATTENASIKSQSQPVIDHEREWKDKYEETVTYEIVRRKKEDNSTPKRKNKISKNILIFIDILLVGAAIYIWLPILLNWL